jgi:protein tyrosine phosphatase
VDVFQAVRHLRYHRSQVVQNLEQYKFCYDMISTYLQEFATYANFR